MRIFNKEENWSSKVNFVDDNNVVLGYDTEEQCCENAGWFIDDQPCEAIRESQEIGCDMPGWNFDPTYFKEVPPRDHWDSGGIVIFRIVNMQSEKFIHLYNVHNGYYGHGFKLEVGGIPVQEGTL